MLKGKRVDRLFRPAVRVVLTLLAAVTFLVPLMASGQTIFTIGDFSGLSPANLSNPQGIAADTSGVYILDTNRKRLVKLLVGGAASVLTDSSAFPLPRNAMTKLAKNSTHLFVSDVAFSGATATGRIFRVPVSGTGAALFGNFTGVGGLKSITGLALLADTLYVFDQDFSNGNRRIIKQRLDGTTAATVLSPDVSGITFSGSFAPTALAARGDTLFILDTQSSLIVKVPPGGVGSKFGTFSTVTLSSPSAIVAGDSALFVLQTNASNKVVKVPYTGATATAFGTLSSGTFPGIAYAGGVVYLINQSGNTVHAGMGAAVPKLSINDVSAHETALSMTFTITLSHKLPFNTIVTHQTTSSFLNTAQAGTDTIRAGQTTTTFNVTYTDNNFFSSPDPNTFTVSLNATPTQFAPTLGSGGVGLGFLRQTGTGKILDDDRSPQMFLFGPPNLPFGTFFGSVTAGSPSTKTIRIVNAGTKPDSAITVSKPKVFGDNFITATTTSGDPLPGEIVIAPRDTFFFNVTFDPTGVKGPVNDSLVIEQLFPVPTQSFVRFQKIFLQGVGTGGSPIVEVLDLGSNQFIDPAGTTLLADTLYVADPGRNRIWKLSKNGGQASFNTLNRGSITTGFLAGLAVANGKLFYTDSEPLTGRGRIARVSPAGGDAAFLDLGSFDLFFPSAIAASPDGQTLYVAGFESNPFLFKPKAKIVKMGVDGSNPAILNTGTARFGFVVDMKVSTDGQTLFISDAGRQSLNGDKLDAGIEPLSASSTFAGAKLFKTPTAGGQAIVLRNDIIPGGIGVTADTLFMAAIGGIAKIPIDGGAVTVLEVTGLKVEPTAVLMDGGVPYFMDFGVKKRIVRLLQKVPDPTTTLQAPGPAPSSVVLQMAKRFFEPGVQDARLPLTLKTDEEVPTGDLQFHLAYAPDTRNVSVDNYEPSERFVPSDTLASLGFDVSVTSTQEDTLSVVITRSADQTIPANQTVTLGELRFDVEAAPVEPTSLPARVVLGTDRLVKILEDAFLSVHDDAGGDISEVEVINGGIRVGIRGDVNLDGKRNVLDVVFLVNQILARPGFDALPGSDTVDHNIRDANEDGDATIGVPDVVAIILRLLRRDPTATPTGKEIVSGPAQVSLGAPFAQADGQWVVPVLLDGGDLSGVQATFTFDPTLLNVGTAQIAGSAEHLLLESQVKDGELRIVALNLQGERLSVGDFNRLALIPVTLLGDKPASLTLASVTGSDRWARTAQIQPGTQEQRVSGREASLPTSFALREARPNPFNPSTTIAYDVPQKAQIRLTVYNTLGQEVVRLVNQVQQAGRYEVTWNGLNTRGQSVASGVYLYRFVSDTGFTASKRMVLLK